MDDDSFPETNTLQDAYEIFEKNDNVGLLTCGIKNYQTYINKKEESLKEKYDFIFIDPPYLERNSDYGNNNHSLDLHEKLFECLILFTSYLIFSKPLSCEFMPVI